jgi:hypothetical protein
MFTKEEIVTLKIKAEIEARPKTEWLIFTDTHGQQWLGNKQGEVRKLGGGSGMPCNAIIYNEDGSVYMKT